MNASEMIALRMRQPFVPFELRLRDGSLVRVDYPYVVATGRESSECIIYRDDHIRFIKYRDVAEVVMTPHSDEAYEWV